MRVRFAKQWVRVSVIYICKCGHKFTRLNTDWFTVNPFNTQTPAEIREDMTSEQKKRKRACPKCKAEVKPSKQ